MFSLKPPTGNTPLWWAALDGLKPSKKTDFKLIADPYDFY